MAEKTSANPALEVVGLTVQRGPKTVLQDVSLRVPPGQVAALLGANGAGKSSLVLSVAGMLPIVSGQLIANGRDITCARPEVVRTAGVSAVPEGHQVLSRLTVEENLIAAGSSMSNAAARSAITDVLSVFPELKPLLRQRAGTLSGGQQQMLAIAQALMTRPRVILFDELSLGLAPVVINRLVAVIEDLVRSGLGVLLIEQFTTIALKLAHRVYVLERGVMRFDGTPAELEANPSVLHDAYLAGKFEAR
jgi:branched-chain amino acid transport system ATP-binding protein